MNCSKGELRVQSTLLDVNSPRPTFKAATLTSAAGLLFSLERDEEML